MNLTLPQPDQIDLTPEHEEELILHARIAAQLAGYKSVRHFTLAALEGIVKQFPVTLPDKKNKDNKK